MTKGDGKPCQRCGTSEWYKGGGCKSCRKEARRQRYQANREKENGRSRRWQQANPEKKKERNRRWRQANPDKAKEAVRRWQQANPEKEKERKRQWAQANPEKKKERNRRWRQANPDKAKEAVRQWRQANPEKEKEKSRRWRQANPEKANENTRRWAQANPEAVAAIAHRRRTRKTKAGGSYTAAEFKALIRHYGGKCLCCGRTDVKLAADHVVPVAKGGSSNIDNIQPLCKSCNSSKGTQTIDYRPDTGLGRWIQKKLFR